MVAIQNPKSSRVGKAVYVPMKILVGLSGFVKANNTDNNNRIFLRS